MSTEEHREDQDDDDGYSDHDAAVTISPAAAEEPAIVDRKRSPLKTSKDDEEPLDEVAPAPKRTKPPPVGMWC